MNGIEGVALTQVGATKSVYWPARPPWETTHVAFKPSVAAALVAVAEAARRDQNHSVAVTIALNALAEAQAGGA